MSIEGIGDILETKDEMSENLEGEQETIDQLDKSFSSHDVSENLESPKQYYEDTLLDELDKPLNLETGLDTEREIGIEDEGNQWDKLEIVDETSQYNSTKSEGNIGTDDNVDIVDKTEFKDNVNSEGKTKFKDDTDIEDEVDSNADVDTELTYETEPKYNAEEKEGVEYKDSTELKDNNKTENNSEEKGKADIETEYKDKEEIKNKESNTPKDNKAGENKNQDAEKMKKMEPPIIIKFICPEGMNREEFIRQLKRQERGLNSQTVAENMDNRAAYEKRRAETGNGRDISEGKKAQEIAREKALQSRIESNQKKGMSYSEAKAEAQEWIKKQAALHNPDQIAGGDPSKVSGMGDAGVNSSIGSQWRSRVEHLKQNVDEYAKDKDRGELENTKMNVKLVVV